MDGNYKLSIENITDYISIDRIKYLTNRSTTEKLKPIGLVISALFFSGAIMVFIGIGFYLIKMTRSHKTKYFEANDIFAVLLHEGIYIWIIVTVIFFLLFLYALFKNFYVNKIKRLFNIIVVMMVYLVFITLVLFLVSILFIPETIGARYFLIETIFLLYILLSVYWCKKRIKVFYKLSEKSIIDRFLDRIKTWIWLVLGTVTAISFATAPVSRDLRSSFYGTLSPFFAIMILPFAYITFYFTLGYLIELYYINKYPEAIRMETNFTKEEWYGPKYQKSKEVMRKIKEFEDYINN